MQLRITRHQSDHGVKCPSRFSPRFLQRPQPSQIEVRVAGQPNTSFGREPGFDGSLCLGKSGPCFTELKALLGRQRTSRQTKFPSFPERSEAFFIAIEIVSRANVRGSRDSGQVFFGVSSRKQSAFESLMDRMNQTFSDHFSTRLRQIAGNIQSGRKVFVKS